MASSINPFTNTFSMKLMEATRQDAHGFTLKIFKTDCTHLLPLKIQFACRFHKNGDEQWFVLWQVSPLGFRKNTTSYVPGQVIVVQFLGETPEDVGRCEVIDIKGESRALEEMIRVGAKAFEDRTATLVL